jgi:NHL repeat
MKKAIFATVALVLALLGGRGILAQSTAAPAQTSTALPTFELDKTWPPKLPNGWVMGQMSSVAIDKRDHVWLLHRPRFIPAEQSAHRAPPVLEFDAAGKFVRGWGGPGAGYEWPENEHGIFVDDKDVVWIGGQAGTGAGVVKFRKIANQRVPVDDDMLLKFTTAGKFLQQIGRQNASGGNQDTKNLKEPADLVIYRKTNEAFIADGYGNRRVIVLDADTGAFKRMWGAFGNVPVDAAPAPLRPGLTGFAEPGPETPPPAGTAATPAPARTPPGPQQFGGPVHAIRVSNDGFVYVADRSNGRVQVFTLAGKYVNQLFSGGSPGSVALSPDKEQQFLYVGEGNQILIVNRKTLAVLASDRFGARGTVRPHQMAIDSKGNVYTAELDYGTQRFAFKGVSSQKP